MIIKKPKDDEYYSAINRVKSLDVDIKKEEDILNNLKHMRTLSMNRIVQSENWIKDI